MQTKLQRLLGAIAVLSALIILKTTPHANAGRVSVEVFASGKVNGSPRSVSDVFNAFNTGTLPTGKTHVGVGGFITGDPFSPSEITPNFGASFGYVAASAGAGELRGWAGAIKDLSSGCSDFARRLVTNEFFIIDDFVAQQNGRPVSGSSNAVSEPGALVLLVIGVSVLPRIARRGEANLKSGQSSGSSSER